MAGGAPGPISPQGIEFSDPATGVIITLGDGESVKPGAEKKMDAIVEGCMAAAKSDLAFLKHALSSLESGKDLSAEELAALQSILGGNTYWRFMKML
jgi:hypothetical protein